MSELEHKEKIEIELDVVEEPDKPDEIDQRHGKLLHDSRLLVEERIRHANRSIERLKLVDGYDEETSCCLFCGRPRNEVEILIGGPVTHICNYCLDICNEVVASEKRKNYV